MKLVAGPDAYDDLPIRLVREKMLGMTLITRIEVGSPARFVWENPVADAMRRTPEPPQQIGHGWGDWAVAAVTTYQQFGRSIRDGAPQYWSHEKGRSDLELTLAMFESGRAHRPLKLPLRDLTEHERQTHEEFERRYERPALST